MDKHPESALSQGIAPDEAGRECAGLRLSLRKTLGLCAPCWGLTLMGLMACVWLIKGRGDTRTWIFACLTAALIPALLLSLRAIRTLGRLNGLIPYALPKDAQTAFNERSHVYHETKGLLRLGCLLLILLIVSVVIGLIPFGDRRSARMHTAAPLVSGTLLSLAFWLITTRESMRVEAATRAVCCAEPVYTDAVRRIFGEDATYRHEHTPPDRIPAFFAGNSADTAHTVTFGRSGCRVTVCDAHVTKPAPHAQETTVFDGILARIVTARDSGRPFSVRRVSDGTMRRLTDPRGGAMSFEDAFRFQGQQKEEARAACEAFLPPEARGRLAASEVAGLSVRPDGDIEVALADLTLIPESLGDINGNLRRLQSAADRLLPLIDLLIGAADPPA
ncbi:MAG: hypothetical protein IJK28_05055 [Clostridia bacterium]|nr:hypothetical protein [Clostridia bacterium]